MQSAPVVQFDRHSKWSSFVSTSRKHSGPLGFFAGFCFDLLTLGPIDDLFFWIPQIFYFSVICAAWSNQWANSSAEIHQNVSSLMQLYLKYRNSIIHFGFGALISHYTVFYFKSASLSASMSFFMILLVFIFLNEKPGHVKNEQFLKSSLFGLCLISFSVCLSAFVTSSMGWPAFILGNIFALSLSLGFYFLLIRRQVPRLELTKNYLLPVHIIYALFFAFYFLRVLPPVPLALKQIGVYHDVQLSDDKLRYVLKHQNPWWRFWHNGDQSFKARPGDQIYVFFRLFSPAQFSQKLTVEWDYYNLRQKKWLLADQIGVEVRGGRQEGYRAFVRKQNFEEGDWRVRVLTEDQREVGRISLTVARLEEQISDSHFFIEHQ